MAEKGTTIGKAYVQIIPTAKGIQASTQKILANSGISKAGTDAGADFGKNLVSKLKMIIAAAGIGKLLKDTLDIGADLEQQMGGVKKIYGDTYDYVAKNAKNAFKTAGVSTADYMRQATTFGEALKKSLDVSDAAKSVDMAIRDMADNANTFGTDLGYLEQAYQSLARGNYEMLDSLNLGYGGTKKELERLLSDADALNAKNGQYTQYSIDNFADIVSAIHVVQKNIGITGTTAKEAEGTFTGSFQAMQASIKNLQGDMALGKDITEDLETVKSTMKTFVEKNLLPMLKNIGQAILDSLPWILENVVQLIADIVKAVWDNMDEIIAAIAEGLSKAFPHFSWLFDFIKNNAEIVKFAVAGIVGAVVLAKVINGVAGMVKNISSGFGKIVKVAKFTGASVKNTFLFIKNLPKNISATWQLATTVIKTKWIGVSSFLSKSFSTIANVGKSAISGIGSALNFLAANPIILIIAGIAALVTAIITLWNTNEEFRNTVIAIWQGFVEVMTTIWDGIVATVTAVWETIKLIFTTAWDAIQLVWNNAISFFQNIWNGISLAFSTVAEFFSNAFTTAWNGITAVWNGATAFFQRVWNGITNIFSAVGGWFSNVFGTAYNAVRNIWNGIGSFFQGVWQTICNIFSNIGVTVGNAIHDAAIASVNGILWMVENALNTPIRLLNGAIDIINYIPGVDIPHISELQLPRLATGGVLDNGARAVLAGEDGAEAIVPLEKNTEWIGKVASQFNNTMGTSKNDKRLDTIIDLLGLIIDKNPNIVLDSGELIGVIDSGLGKLRGRYGRG